MKMSRAAVLVALAAAIGNLLQGWDNSTIAGALLYIKTEFHLETQPTTEGLLVAMSLIGSTLITPFAGGVSDGLGRRPILIISAVLRVVSGAMMLWSPKVYVLLFARLLDGFGIAGITIIPIYISETAPPEIRGLVSTFPPFIGSLGVCLSYCVVFGMSLIDSPSWRLMLGVISIPSIVYFGLGVFYLPESPRWLVSKGGLPEAEQVLQRLLGSDDVNVEMSLLIEGLGKTHNVGLPCRDEIENPLIYSAHNQTPEGRLIGWKDLLEDPGVKQALFVGIGVQMLQQFSGINGVQYYAPQILEQDGIGVLLSNIIGISSTSASILISAFMTLLMLVATAIAMWLMDISGRRTLLLTTIPVLILTLTVLAAFGTGVIDLGKAANASISTICVVVYSFFFVMGLGPVPGILCAEIFPTRVRGICIAICTMAFWISDIIVTYSFPVMMSSIGLGAVFGIYAAVCILTWFFVFFNVPETKGMHLEAISDRFFSLGAKAPPKSN